MSDPRVPVVAEALHEDLCGCEYPMRSHGRTYMELAHVAIRAADSVGKEDS